MYFKQVFSYIHFLAFQHRNLIAIDFHLYWLHIRDFGVGSSVLICCGHIKVWNILRDVTHFGEGVRTVSHEIVNSLVKSVVMWIPRGTAGSTAWEERQNSFLWISAVNAAVTLFYFLIPAQLWSDVYSREQSTKEVCKLSTGETTLLPQVEITQVLWQFMKSKPSDPGTHFLYTGDTSCETWYLGVDLNHEHPTKGQ